MEENTKRSEYNGSGIASESFKIKFLEFQEILRRYYTSNGFIFENDIEEKTIKDIEDD